MPIDDLFQASTDQVLDDRVARPLQTPTAQPSFGSSVWRAVKAVPKGIVAGANESVAFGADILNAYGQTQAGIGLQADPTQLFDPEAQRKRTADGEQARAALASGDAYSTEIGTNLRTTARDMMPDPATSNLVENTLFGLSRFAAKAIGYSLAAGPVPGAVLAGTDEGMTEADRLKSQGVDLSTRTQVGMVAGLSTAAAVALPVAGKTLPQTIGLVAAGGPGGFIAQQAASKAILEHADYGKIADQYDPFDPVGLAVSTLVPAGFGAYALRGVRAAAKIPTARDPAAARQLVQMAANERLALKYDDPRLDAYATAVAQREGIPPEALLAIKNVGEKSGPTAVSPAGAKGVMQFMDSTWTAYGKGDARDPVASIDAGARYMKDLIKQYDGDVRAAIAHYNGGGKAGEAVRAGKRPPAAETQKYLDRTDAYLAERQGTEAGKAAAQDPEAVAAARVALVREAVDSSNLHAATDIRGADDHMAAVMRASDQIAAGERVDVSEVIAPERLDVERVSDVVTRVQRAVEELRLAAAEEVGLRPRSKDGIQPAPRLTGEALSGKSYQELETMHSQAIDHNKVVDLEGIQKFWGADQAKEAAGWGKRKREKWLAENETEAASNWMQDRYINDELIAGHMHAVNNFDSADAHALGRSIALLSRKVDEAGFFNTPEGNTFSNALRYAKEQGWNLDDVMVGIRERAANWAGADAPELFSRLFDRVTKPSETASNAGHQNAPQNIHETIQGDSAAKRNSPSGLLDAQAAEIARLSPDMLVQLEGMEAPMRLADALEAVKAEAANDVRDAPLLQVAAECFLRSS